MSIRFFVLLILVVVLTPIHAQFNDVIYVTAGDTQGLIDAVKEAGSRTTRTNILVREGPNGENEFIFTGPAEGSDSALPGVSFADINISPEFASNRIILKADESVGGQFRLININGNANTSVSFFRADIEGFGSQNGDGGAILVEGGAHLRCNDVNFRNNFAGGNGGAVATHDMSSAEISNGTFTDNRSANVGGALTVQDDSRSLVKKCSFRGNMATVFGCDINVNARTIVNKSLVAHSNVFKSDCGNVLIENPQGVIEMRGNSFSNPDNAIDSTDFVSMFSTLFDVDGPANRLQASGERPPVIQAACNDFGTGAFESLGYNISADDSCALDRDTDLPGTDPMVADNADGFPVPQPGSPAIDAGSGEVIVHEGDTMASLPCSYTDLSGTARPQDGNNNGVYACDMGAMEAIGPGTVVDGHSGAFFNPGRNGEGSYVEILSDSLAVVYTFTYRPDGSGPAWFLGVGQIVGNSIIIEDLRRPIGTSFGEEFNTEDIELTPVGSMNIVVPNCVLAAPGGSTAFTGDTDAGYEAVLTRAVRLSTVASCGPETPSPNAGLSGSFYDPARNGEGVIVEWLTNGDVLVIFFTFDQDNNQMWVFGQGSPNGTTVTMDAFYASASTAWGRAFDADDVTISPWGEFTLTWTQCDAVRFDYSSTVTGYGSSSHDYVRLSQLAGTSCPDF